MIKDLLLHTLTILFPVMIIQTLLLDKFHARKTLRMQILIGIISGVSAVLCMTFPVNLDSGFSLDFRWIPLLSAILYGGYLAGGTAVGLSMGYIILQGGSTMYFSLVGSLLFVVVPLMLVPSFYKRSRKQRFIICLAVSALACVYVIINICFILTYIDRFSLVYTFKYLFGLSFIIQMILTLLAVSLIEKAIVISQLKTEIEQTEKLVMISELAASVAHEVRNPLTVVRGFIQLAKSKMDEKGQQYMTTAVEELDRAEFIISDYLSFAKPQVERIDDIDISLLVHNVVTLMTSYATVQGIIVDHHIESNLFVRGDQVKLKQVLINLIKNGVEAMNHGGSIELKAFKRNKHIMIQVMDTGEGMTEEQLKQLGNIYYSTKEKGTGIGLMVAFQIVDAMGGRLLFESTKGVGTTATIRLPQIANERGVSTS